MRRTPFTIEDMTFETARHATLMVHRASIKKYRNANVWKLFKRIVALDGDYDVNGDNTVNIADVNAVVDYIFGNDADRDIGDINNDGEINIADINAIINMILTQD